MGNSNAQKKKGTIDLPSKKIDKEKNDGNIINDNSINNNGIRLDVVIETLIRIFRFEKNIKELNNNENNSNNDSRCVIASKKLIDKYKEIFDFEKLKIPFDKNDNILKHINKLLSIKNKVNKDEENEIIKKNNISNIIEELKNLKIKIQFKNNNSLSELNNEYKLNYQLINSKGKKKKVYVDFEIIDFDIFLLLIGQNISANYFLFANYFISFDKILIIIKEYGNCSSNIICELGKYNKNDQCINIEYLLNSKKLEDSYKFKEKFNNSEVSHIYQEINKTNKNINEIQYIDYNFEFDNDKENKIIFIDNNKESDEKQLEKNKKKDLNNIVKKYDENGINIIGRDSGNLINDSKDYSEEDEKKQKCLIDKTISNDQEYENRMEAQNKNDTIIFNINKIAFQNNNSDKNSSSEIPQSQNNFSDINNIDETNEENVFIPLKLRQFPNKNNIINPSIRDPDKIDNNHPLESESLKKHEVDKKDNEIKIEELDNSDVVNEFENNNLKNSNNDTQINSNNNTNVIENPEGLKDTGNIVEVQKEEQNNINNSQETGVVQNKNDTKNEQIRAIVENDNKGSDNVLEEPQQDERQLDEIDIVESSSNNDKVDKINNNNGINQNNENIEISKTDNNLKVNAKEQKNNNKGNNIEKLNKINVNAEPENASNKEEIHQILDNNNQNLSQEKSNAEIIQNNKKGKKEEENEKGKIEQNNEEKDKKEEENEKGKIEENNEEKDKKEEENEKGKIEDNNEVKKVDNQENIQSVNDENKIKENSLPIDDKKNENAVEIFKDKEDSGDKNEESADLPDDVIEIAEVSPNINNIEKEELKDKEDSVDKNEENADLPDDEIEIAEASQNISDIKKEDSIQDSADNKEETEQPDEVGEIADVSPNMDCIEKEELKDKKDSVDQNEESIGLPDELFEIAEPSPNINCIEKEKPIEDTTDKNEETESPDEVGEIAEVSPDMNCIEKEELKDKTDSVDTNDKSIENPDEVNENAGASPSISENNKNDNIDKQVQDQPSHIILKKFSLPHRKLNAKTKQLLLFSIYQKKTTEAKSNRNDIKENEDVILINKEFFEKYFYNEILDLVSDDNEFKDEINNIDINNFSISSIKNIIIRLDNDKLNAVNDKISNVNENEINSLLKPKEQEVHLISKEIKIYNEFVVINKQIFTNFEKIFNINLNPQNVSYVSFKKDFILKLKENEETVLILGRYNKENSSNEVSYILDFKMQEEFNNQFPMVHSYGIDYYVSDKLMFEKGLENDYISPIFNLENMLGYGYKYEPTITDYTKHDNYIKFLNCENLDNIITLFSYEMLYEEKKKSQQLFENGKYYLVNQEYYNYFKKKYNYNLISKIISPYEPENVKNLYTFIKKVPSNKLDMYWNYKMEEVLFDKNSESYYMVEPESIIVDYNKDKQVISFDNFLLIDEKSGKAFSDNKESSHICCECTFIDGKIIIDLPNYLNHSGMVPKCVSIIGNLYVDRCFKIEYILIYVTEAGRKNHLDSIKNNLKENLRNLKFKDNIYTFNFQSNEVTIIKYKKKDNFKLETYFKQRPKIGLDNIGATCYMNSTLQCLTHIDGLVDYFKYDPQIEEVKQNHQNLSSSFKTLVDNLYPDNLTSNRYAPNDFKEKISVMNPLFKGIAANDAKDLVNFIIMTLHNELNKKDEIPDENKDLPQNPDQSNKEQSYLSFENEILREHRSIISDLFYGINRNETQCCNCGKNIYNYQTYFFINFPLEVVRQYRAQKMSNNMMFPMNQMNQLNSNEVDIIDCFENEERITTLAGENSMYCNGCRQNAPSNMRTVLITGPEELILILNRGKGKEFDIKLNFTENLNLYKFIEKKETGYKYKLTGVITHLGESSMSGHFIAFCIDQTNKKWYKYNDSMVDEIKDFEKEVVNNSNIMPYLLFYHKLNQAKK